MINKIKFKYFYGKESEQFTFFRIPKLLFTDKNFRKLSNDAKLLYGLMLDRMSLSIKNDWKDDLDRTYIIYTVEQMVEDLACGKEKALKAAAELDSKKGIGLIERVRRGQGKPDIIYVKNYVINDEESDPVETTTPPTDDEEPKIFPESKAETAPEVCQNSEVGISEFQKSENPTSRIPENRFLEVGKSDPNNTDLNYNNISYTYPINLSSQKEKNAVNLEYYEKYKAFIKYNIEYDALCQVLSTADLNMVDTIVELMTEVAMSSKDSIIISGSSIPKAIVMSRFEKYDMNTIQYVLYCMNENASDIRNIKSYLLATLYNAPMMMNAYYQQKVNHDLYGQ